MAPVFFALLQTITDRQSGTLAASSKPKQYGKILSDFQEKPDGGAVFPGK